VPALCVRVINSIPSEFKQLYRWFNQFQTSHWKLVDTMELRPVWSLSWHCS